jgi:hypothetical protein
MYGRTRGQHFQTATAGADKAQYRWSEYSAGFPKKAGIMSTIGPGKFAHFTLLNANLPEEDIIAGLAVPRTDSS